MFRVIRASWRRDREREREGRGSSRDGETAGLFELKLTRCVQVVWESVLLETSAKRARRKLDSFFIA